MIDPEFLILTPAGLYCKAGDFFLDPNSAVRNAVITHAHGDHAPPGCIHVYATPATISFMKLRFRKSAGKEIHEYAYHTSFYLNDIKITFIPGGHILGSAQIKMEYQECIYLYTGDIKLQADSSCEAVEFSKADVLITETTFAKPDTQHPDPQLEIQKLQGPGNYIIGAYVLGKAQRLTRLINEYCPDKKVYIHYSILPYHSIYKAYGYDPGNWEPYDKRRFTYGKDMIYLVPPLTYNSYKARGEKNLVFASGWDFLQSDNTLKLFISDHIDWNDLLILIERTEAKEVWTLHGDGSYLSSHFKGTDLHVKVLNDA